MCPQVLHFNSMSGSLQIIKVVDDFHVVFILEVM